MRLDTAMICRLSVAITNFQPYLDTDQSLR